MKTRIKKIISIMGILLVLAASFSASSFAAEPRLADSQRVIRVCYPIFYGFSEEDENGNLSGYNYEFLMKIAQRTGWKYEFLTYEATNENIQAGLDKVKDGEMDLVLGMVYSDVLAEAYDYTTVPYGESNFVLLADSENDSINKRTYSDISKLRVAMIPTAKTQNSMFEEYANEKGISYEAIDAENSEACKELVKSGKADVLISKDVLKNEGFKTVITFASQPFYFAVTKGNTGLAEELSRIITEINDSDPYYTLKLHDKYFKSDSDNQLALTADELDYLNHVPVIRALVLNDNAPVEDYDEQTGEYSGIIVDIMKKIAAESGIPIEFVHAESLAQARGMIAEGEADILAGFPYDYPTGEEYEVLLTSPIYKMPVVRVANLDGQAEHDETLISSSITIFDGEEGIAYLEDTGEILDQVNRGKYRAAYVNGYIAQHYVELYTYSNIMITQVPFNNYDLCIGVYQNSDLRLMGILEQAIAKLNTSEVEDIVYKNTVHTHSNSLFDYIKRNPMDFFLPVIVISAALIAMLLILFFKSKRLNKLISAEKNRYQMISTMDRLSNTYNNDAFKQMSSEYLSLEQPSPQGVLLICDIDGFKAINDTFGHLMGDEVIKSLGGLLQDIFFDNALVGRLGGDEFLILMKDVSRIQEVEEHCRELLKKSRTIADECVITLSIGGAMFSGPTRFEELLKAADQALYVVKNRGKNGFEIVRDGFPAAD